MELRYSQKTGVNRKRVGASGEDGGGGIRSFSAWKGANDIPWGRKGVPGGPGIGGNYTN